jgi:CheY-like chemotaxis protein
MTLLVLVVDDEPDVEALFRQQFRREMRAAKAMLPDLPIIMITAYGDGATLRRAKEAGAEGVFGKPTDFAALKAEIDQCLAARGLPA